MKTALLKSNLLIKPSIVLAVAVLTAASFLASSTATAADPYPMPTGRGGGHSDDRIQPYDPNPAAPDSMTREFLTYGFDSDSNPIPLKTLRITNNSADTVYPIMRDPNSNVLAKPRDYLGLYDPYDPPNKEYRGYIGYEEGGKYYFGLKKGESILVSIPLVFWNGARIGIGTDGKYLTPAGLPNPLRWDRNGNRSITDAQTSRDTIRNGVVMWYRAGIAEAPNDDTEDQLAEWTIRDHGYLVNREITAKTNREIPDNQLVTLINYDVSNVDNLYLPLAMEANNVWVVPQKSGTGPTPNRTGWGPGSDPIFTDGPEPSTRSSSCRPESGNSPPATTNSLDSISAKKRKAGPFITFPTPPTTRTRPSKSRPAPTSLRKARSRRSLPAMATESGRTTNTCSRAGVPSRSRRP